MNIFTTILVQPLANGLVLFYRLLGSNMGLAIIGFSIFLRVVLEPLTRPYMESMKKMRDYAPQLEKIKQRHKGDRAKLAEAQAAFYKEKGINIGAGCLPMILQFVVLIALYQVFIAALSNGNISHFNDLLYQPLKFASGQIINTKFLYLDIVKPDNINLSFIPFPIPGLIVILAAISQMISAKMATPYLEAEKKLAKKTKGNQDDMMAAMQSSSIYTFPLLTLLIGVKFPSGLAIYWLVFSLYQAYQQYRVTGWGGATGWVRKLSRVVSFTRAS